MKFDVTATHQVEFSTPPGTVVALTVPVPPTTGRKYVLTIVSEGVDQEKAERKVQQTIDSIMEALKQDA